MHHLRALAAVSTLALLASCTPELASNTISWKEQRATLKNGMRVVVLPDTTTQLVHVGVRYEVGANEDPIGKAGLAHLVEHMMFQHRPLGPDKPPTFQIIPQLATAFNAYTIWDKTHYYIEAPKEDLETVLRIEAFRMAAGCETIPPEQFDREREVVRNEIRQRGGTAEGLIPKVLGEALYPAGHPYSHTVGGDDAQLSSITFQDTCDFMQRYYAPERATLYIAGNVTPEEVGKLVNVDFGAIPARTPAPRVEVKPIELQAKTIEQTLDIEKPVLVVAFALPSMADEEYTKAQALFLSAGRIAALATEYDDCIRGAGATPYGGDLAPVFMITMELCNNDHFDEALDWVWKVAKDPGRGLKFIEFNDDQRARVRQGFIEQLETLAARTGWLADYLQTKKEKVNFGQERQILYDELDRLNEISADGFASFARKTLRKDKAVVIKIKASDKGLKGDTRTGLKFSAKSHDKDVEPIVDPAEAKRPLPAPKSASILGKAERYTLGNGMKIVLLPTESPLPIVSSQLIFNAGAVHESDAKAGLAGVAANFLHPESEANFAMTGVSVGGGADDESTTFYSGGLASYTDIIITALERVVRIGVYSQEQIEDYQKSVKQRFESKQFREQREYQTALFSALFGADHPYTVRGSATPASVGNIGYDAAMGFKRSHYTAKNATFIMVGGFDVTQAKQIISDTFGDWSAGSADKPIAPTQRPRSGPEYIGVVGKEMPQMDVTIAYPAPAGIDGQQAARMVMTEMLNLRLAAIRTELGSTYGTYAGKQNQLGPSAYRLGGGVDAARAGESLKAMREKVDSLRRGDDFDKDFVVARRTVLKKLIGESSEPSALTGRLAFIAAYGQSPDYFDTLTKLVAAMSPAQVKALIKSELDPAREIVVCKADRVTLEKAFVEAGLGNVRMVEPK